MKKTSRKLQLKKQRVLMLHEQQATLLQMDQPVQQQRCSGEDCFSRISCWPTKPF
ncbi:MAG: hypothetical protein JNM68_07200 [Dinghuibacter sp.]|nr:hypothetical protein [Dinghuibacter sp.]